MKFIKKAQLEHLELRLSRYRRHAFGKHTHDTYSIGAVFDGRTNFFHQHETQRIGSGSIAFINPDEVHACNPVNGSMLSYSMFYVEPELIEEIASALYGCETGPAYFATVTVENRRIFRDLYRLSSLIADDDVTMEAESMVYTVLGDIIQHYGDVKILPRRERSAYGAVEAGRVYLLDNLYKNVSLQDVALHSGLSPYHFLREFRKRYGLPPHTYQLQQRVNVAKRLLNNGEPIAQVASAVGFADQSHFTRKFKVFVGATPRQYQLAQC